MDILVIGTGYVGLVAACCLAYSGHKVIAVEKNQDKLSQLKSGIMPIYEGNLDKIFNRVISDGSLTFKSRLEDALSSVSIIMVAVGTPSLSDGRVDLSQVHDVCENICRLANRPLTVIMKSTVPPGVGNSINRRFFKKAKVSISYVSNPEFLREGRAVEDWYNPDRIVIGSDDRNALNLVIELYSDLNTSKVCMDITSAEMVKYASNAFLATKISFINEIANLCERVGANIDLVSNAVGMDKRIGTHFFKAGLGYGGSCFPKDVKGLNYVSVFNGYTFSLLKAVIEVNNRQRILVIRKLRKTLGELVDKKIAVLGLAFKPGTNDIREAPSLDIIEQLLSEGAKVSASDPVALDNARLKLNTSMVDYYINPYQACKNCNAVILATEWQEFLTLDWFKIKRTMMTPYVVLDGRNALNKDVMLEYGFQYIGIGRQIKE